MKRGKSSSVGLDGDAGSDALPGAFFRRPLWRSPSGRVFSRKDSERFLKFQQEACGDDEDVAADAVGDLLREFEFDFTKHGGVEHDLA